MVTEVQKTSPIAGYIATSRSLPASFIITLPLLLIYEVGVYLINSGKLLAVTNGADALIQRVTTFGGAVPHLYGVVIAVLALLGLTAIQLRSGQVKLAPGYFLLMLVEATALAFILAPIVLMIMGQAHLFNAIGQTPMSDPLSAIVYSFGAGYYEELLFRVILVTGLIYLFTALKLSKILSWCLAGLIGAAVFSGMHYVGALGDSFSWSSFMFRFLFGMLMNVVYLTRGFGVAAWSHALYDVFISLHIGIF